MSNYKIKVEGVADFSKFKKEVDSLNRTVHAAFGDGIKIFDEKSIDVMKREVSSSFEQMRIEVSRLNKEGKELAHQFKLAAADSKKQEELGAKQLANAKKRVEAEKELFKLKQSQNTLTTGMTPSQSKAAEKDSLKVAKLEERRRSGESITEFNQRQKQSSATGQAGKSVGKAAGSAAHGLPAIGEAIEVGAAGVEAGAAGVAAGLSNPAVAAIAALAAAATAAAVAVTRMKSGYEVFLQGVPNMLKVSGMGAKPVSRDSRAMSAGISMGYGPLDMLSMQGDMLGAFGKGANQREDSNKMINSVTLGRGMGMDPSTIFSGGNQLRAAGGTDQASKQMALILEKSFTSGMDKTQATHFLNAAVGLLTDLNTNGTSDANELIGVMTGLVANKNMSSEQAAKTISGMSNAIGNSSGESNAFFQSSAVNAGLGNNTLLGTQFAVRQGLSGVDMGALNKQVGDTQSGQEGIKAIQEMGLGDSNFTQKFAGSILDKIKSMFGHDTPEDRAGKLGFVGQMFGAKSAPEAVKILAVLEKMKTGTSLSKEDKHLLEDLGKDPQQTWRDKVLASLDASARGTAAIQAASEAAKFNLGEASSKIFGDLTSALTTLDKTIAKVISSDTFKSLWDGMADGVRKAFDGIGKAFDALPEFSKRLATAFEEGFKDATDFGVKMGKAFVETVKGWWDSVEKFFKGLMDVWETLFGKLNEKTGKREGGMFEIEENRVKIKGAAGAAIDSGISSVKDGIKGAVNGVANTASGAYDTAKNFLGLGGDKKDVVKSLKGDSEDGAPSMATPPSAAPPAAGKPGYQGASLSPDMNINVNQDDVVNALNKQTQLLEKMARPGARPLMGRDSSRGTIG